MKSIVLLTLTLALKAIAFSQAPTDGLVAYWPMNGNYTDAGPNSITGTNGASTSTTNKNGAANKAMGFSNPSATVTTVAQFATHPINSNLNFVSAQDFSISFLTYINSPYVHACGLYDNNLNYGGYGLYFWNSNGYPQIQFNFKNNTVGTTNGALSLGAWYFITAVRENNTLKIYVNGTLNNSAVLPTGTAPTYSFPARFGTMFYNSYPHYNGLHGKLDEFRIYNRVLTAAEISAMNATVLPIKLSNFSAENKNDIVHVHWQTTEEINTSHFEVERSVDGIHFYEISKVNANGNSSTRRDYSFNDKLPITILSEPKIYYRLKSIDIDGKFTYTSILVILLKKINEQLMIFPTPTKEILNIQTANITNGKAAIFITDIAGKLILKKEITLFSANNSFPLDVSILKSGLYHIQLNTNSNSYTKQFIKVE